MKVIVTTMSGAKYTLDDTARTWERETGQKELRWYGTDTPPTSGDMIYMPEIVIGESMYILVGDPFRADPSQPPRMGETTTIRTTPVTNFENVED